MLTVVPSTSRTGRPIQRHDEGALSLIEAPVYLTSVETISTGTRFSGFAAGVLASAIELHAATWPFNRQVVHGVLAGAIGAHCLSQKYKQRFSWQKQAFLMFWQCRLDAL